MSPSSALSRFTSNNLVTLGSAAVLAVYAAGYVRTKPAADRLAAQSAGGRRALPGDVSGAATGPHGRIPAEQLLGASATTNAAPDSMTSVSSGDARGDTALPVDSSSKVDAADVPTAAASLASSTAGVATLPADSAASRTDANANTSATTGTASTMAIAGAATSMPLATPPTPTVSMTASIPVAPAPVSVASATVAQAIVKAPPPSVVASTPPATMGAATSPMPPAPAAPEPKKDKEKKQQEPKPPKNAPAPAVTAPAKAKIVYRDGLYLGRGNSRHGPIEAMVEIVDGRIASAIISLCGTQYSCSWIADLVPQVAARQSPDVDNVTGATESANAFYYAVVQALAQAK